METGARARRAPQQQARRLSSRVCSSRRDSNVDALSAEEEEVLDDVLALENGVPAAAQQPRAAEADSLEVAGLASLEGHVPISGAKNSALAVRARSQGRAARPQARVEINKVSARGLA